MCCRFGEDIEIVLPICQSVCVFFCLHNILYTAGPFISRLDMAVRCRELESGAVLQCEDCVVCIECVCGQEQAL